MEPSSVGGLSQRTWDEVGEFFTVHGTGAPTEKSLGRNTVFRMAEGRLLSWWG